MRSKEPLRGAAMVRAGVDAGLLDEIIWWQSDDLWVWTSTRSPSACAWPPARTGFRVAEVCERLAQRHGVDLGTPN